MQYKLIHKFRPTPIKILESTKGTASSVKFAIVPLVVH